jgi:hypothetical protein
MCVGVCFYEHTHMCMFLDSSESDNDLEATGVVIASDPDEIVTAFCPDLKVSEEEKIAETLWFRDLQNRATLAAFEVVFCWNGFGQMPPECQDKCFQYFRRVRKNAAYNLASNYPTTATTPTPVTAVLSSQNRARLNLIEGSLLRVRGSHDLSFSQLETALLHCTTPGDRLSGLRAFSLYELAMLEMERGNVNRARELNELAMADQGYDLYELLQTRIHSLNANIARLSKQAEDGKVNR